MPHAARSGSVKANCKEAKCCEAAPTIHGSEAAPSDVSAMRMPASRGVGVLCSNREQLIGKTGPAANPMIPVHRKMLAAP